MDALRASPAPHLVGAGIEAAKYGLTLGGPEGGTMWSGGAGHPGDQGKEKARAQRRLSHFV
jgi:hypothetical protein